MAKLFTILLVESKLIVAGAYWSYSVIPSKIFHDFSIHLFHNPAFYPVLYKSRNSHVNVLTYNSVSVQK